MGPLQHNQEEEDDDLRFMCCNTADVWSAERMAESSRKKAHRRFSCQMLTVNLENTSSLLQPGVKRGRAEANGRSKSQFLAPGAAARIFR